MAGSPNLVGRAICEAFGINPNEVVKFVLTSEVNNIDTLEVTSPAYDKEAHTIVVDSDTDKIVEELRYYKLVPMTRQEKIDRAAVEAAGDDYPIEGVFGAKGVFGVEEEC